MDNLAYCVSNVTDKYGVKWSVSARSLVCDDGEEYLAVSLHAEHNFHFK